MDVISIEENKNNQVKKANALIEAKGALSSTAQKILIMLISMLRTDDSEFQKYALNIKDFKQELGTTNNEVKFYVERAKELMRNPFEVDKKLFNWCSMVDYGSIEGYLVFDIHNDLKPYLLGLQKNFTTYNIVNILALKGDYTPRLYEYFLMRFNKYKAQYKKQHNKTPKSYTFELKIDWLRDTFKIPDSYNYADIKRQIIEKAKKQFNEKTNIKFDYKEHKIGRKVDILIVTVENNNKGSNDYLVDLQSFIRFVRRNLINQDIWQGQGMVLSVGTNGKIYDKKTLKEYANKNAQVVWEKWYELAKQDKLLILKQGLLF
jgi:plasmid replication initiation protein